MRKTDFPRLRAWDQCPLCGGAKPRGGLCCWECFNSRGIGAGDDDPYADAQFQRAERALQGTSSYLIDRMRGIEHGLAITRPQISKAEIVKLADAARLDTLIAAHYARHGICGVRVVHRADRFILQFGPDLEVEYETAEALEAQAMRFGGAITIAEAPC